MSRRAAPFISRRLLQVRISSAGSLSSLASIYRPQAEKHGDSYHTASLAEPEIHAPSAVFTAFLLASAHRPHLAPVRSTMARVITVEREYGSRGAEFAHLLASRLGWKPIDQSLVEEIARRAGVAKSRAAHCDERLDPWYYRLGKSFWFGSVERLPPPPTDEVFDSELMARLVREYLRELAAEGNCVIVGRGSACALAKVPEAFHLFIYASTASKVRWFEEKFPGHAGDARHEIEAVDARRESYIRRYYDSDWTDRRLYGMMLNSAMGFSAMIDAVTAAAGLALPTT